MRKTCWCPGLGTGNWEQLWVCGFMVLFTSTYILRIIIERVDIIKYLFNRNAFSCIWNAILCTRLMMALIKQHQIENATHNFIYNNSHIYKEQSVYYYYYRWRGNTLHFRSGKITFKINIDRCWSYKYCRCCQHTPRLRSEYIGLVQIAQHVAPKFHLIYRVRWWMLYCYVWFCGLVYFK